MTTRSATPAGGLDRRAFLRRLGGGLAVLWCIRVSDTPARAAASAGLRTDVLDERTVAGWLHIGEDGVVSVFTGKTEVGQNIRTSLAQGVAEELSVPVESIRLVMADTDLVPFDRGTFGSLTTPQMNLQLRRAASVARESLLDLAVERFRVARTELEIADGRIVSRDGRRTSTYGELTGGSEITRVIDGDVAPKSAQAWTVMGTSVPKVNGRDFVTGRHRFTSDMRLPNMVHGRVVRPAAFGASLVRVDTSAAEGMVGVEVVRDGSFVGIVTEDPALAAHALGGVRAEWRTSPQVSAAGLWEHVRQTAQAGGRAADEAGSVSEGLAGAAHALEHTYTVAFIAHVPLEPRAALTEWKDGRMTVWTGTQRPFGVRTEVARALGLDEDRVRIIVPDTGSGYGGKHSGEAAVEAARLARAVGRPVKVVWTREEEFTWAYARPAGVVDVVAGCRSDGALTAWEFRNLGSGGASIRLPYDCPNRSIEFRPAELPLRHGSYRALASTANNFARECHVDDLAHAAGIDPVAFRLKNLSDPRLRAVVEAAAERVGWAGAGSRALGFACGVDKGSYIATCAEIAIDAESRRVRVLRLASAYECGAVVNPKHLLNQVEGGILMGLGGALFEALDFADGRILNPRLSQYRVPRFRDMPELDTVVLDRTDLPSAGAGETPIIAVAPAIRNAIAAATGIRLRALPLVPHGLPPA
ncbi:hypothetical protein ASA1KI_06980 [Opitutales bacterium ASA1]|uniref:xanthine dehydrogenase family protein molybdopterin-binding subunit n=1 Tax=Congregicoccus parvus TaxID=3081749 RepID=UPI002B29BC26|nr:hypothetical protein ASA1KI_06980 [Opitutales bacterium ASA1]